MCVEFPVMSNKLDFEKPHPYNVRWGTFEEMVKKQEIERQLFPTTEATCLECFHKCPMADHWILVHA